MELIDWSERYPEATSRQLAVIESTYCPCGNPKQIGQRSCNRPNHKLTPEVKAYFNQGQAPMFEPLVG
jgi:hypothetical protein